MWRGERGNVLGRTFDSLVAELDERDRRYQQRFESQERAVTAALLAAQLATDAALKAAAALAAKTEQFADEKLASHNQIRPWVTSQVAAVDKDVATIEARLDRRDGRDQGLSRGWQMLLGLAAIAGVIAAIYEALHR
jgi:hypothetical protein